MISKFKRARNAGTPLIAINSFDPGATMVEVQKAFPGAREGRESTIPFIQWDIISGFRGRNQSGLDAISEATKGSDVLESISPVRALEFAADLPEGSILFMLNTRHFMDKPDFCQALWNLRDDFKADSKTVVLIGQETQFPAELRQDILILDEPLPNEEQLKSIITDLAEANDIALKKDVVGRAVDALRGIAAFPAEQSVAMCLDIKLPEKLDIQELWDNKRQLISSTPGLKVYSGTEKFDDIGGCEQVKKYLTGVIEGREAPRVIVFIDEGEKMFAGSTGPMGDSSGVSQDFLGTTLSYMEDNECDGAIFVGPPGAAKSAISKAVGNEAEVPTILLDMGGMKGSLVGQSESRLREAFKIITAVGGGRAYFIMTCNRIASLPPELRRRFTSGVFFFDLPDHTERQKIWEIYLKKYELKDQVTFDDEGWTGAEIRNCCRLAYRQKISLDEAAKFIVPVSKSSADQIEQLRQQASGAYLSAGAPGIYKFQMEQAVKAKARSIRN